MAFLFTRETWLDLVVNIIPLGIMAFFVALFLVVDPWSGTLFGRLQQMALIVVPIVGLAVLTYVAAVKIER